MRSFFIPTRLLVAILALGIFAVRLEAGTFTILGTETKERVELTFTITELTGTSLPSKSWNSNNTKYQDDETDVFVSLEHWDVRYTYDAATKSLKLAIFHKIDPHTGNPPPGGPFSWDVGRPAAIPIEGTNYSYGIAEKFDLIRHRDSLGEHSDAYKAEAKYYINVVDRESRPPTNVDQFVVHVVGTHEARNVADSSSALVLFILGFGSLVLGHNKVRPPHGATGA